MKSDKNRAQIDFIKNLLRKNEKRRDILGKFGEKWEKVSRTTFDRRLETAKDEVLEENKAKEEIRNSLLPTEIKSEIEANIATETELDLVMSKLAMGEVRVQEFIKGEAVVRSVTPAEMIAAADKLYKRKGSYAPIKKAETDPDGNPVTNTGDLILIDVSLLSTEQLKLILEKQNKQIEATN